MMPSEGDSRFYLPARFVGSGKMLEFKTRTTTLRVEIGSFMYRDSSGWIEPIRKPNCTPVGMIYGFRELNRMLLILLFTKDEIKCLRLAKERPRKATASR